MFTLGAISCRDQTSDMQTSLWEAFQHSRLVVVTLRGHTATRLSLTSYSLIATAFIVLGLQHHGWLEHFNNTVVEIFTSSFQVQHLKLGLHKARTSFCLFIVVQRFSACVDELFKHSSRCPTTQVTMRQTSKVVYTAHRCIATRADTWQRQV